VLFVLCLGCIISVYNNGGVVAGYSQQQFGAFNKWRTVLEAASVPYVPVEPKKSCFKPKYNLPLLASYEGKFPADFWDGCRVEVRWFDTAINTSVRHVTSLCRIGQAAKAHYVFYLRTDNTVVNTIRNVRVVTSPFKFA
jgi:hypothetical protein